MGPKKKTESECKEKSVKGGKLTKGHMATAKRKGDRSEEKPAKKEKPVEKITRVNKRKSDESESETHLNSKEDNFHPKRQNKRLKNAPKQSPANLSKKQKQIKSQPSNTANKKSLLGKRTKIEPDTKDMQINADKELVNHKRLVKSKESKSAGASANKNSQTVSTKLKIVESKTKKSDATTKTVSKIKSKTQHLQNEESSSSESEWEDVAEEPTQDIDDYNPVIPDGGVEITLEGPSMPRKRQKKAFDMMEYIRLEINKGKKEDRLIVHQVHLLCLLARGVFINKILVSDELKAFALSFIPDAFFEVKADKVDVAFVGKLVNWFRSSFIVDENFKSSKIDVKKAICKCFEHQKASSSYEYNLMFIVIARTLCLNIRFCLSLYPLSFKATDLLKKGKFGKDISKEENSKTTEKCVPTAGTSSKPDPPTNENISSKKTSKTIQKEKNKSAQKKQKIGNKKIANKDIVKRSTPKRSTKKSYKLSSDEDVDDVDSDKSFELDDISDDDEPRKHSKKRPSKKSNRKILSSESGPSSPEATKHQEGLECWLEVFCKKETKWISVECFHNIINKPYQIEKIAQQPVTYVVCYDNFSYLKDVTKRYSAQWMTHTRKLRVVHDWWLDSLEPFLPPDTKQDRDEECQMEVNLLRKPMPSTISEFKNHPLYALKRHLLKFQGIYPSDAPSIGFVRGEPVYARECIHTLHSRETWLKEARLVRVKEEPYKIVKARPKWDRLTGNVTTDIPLNLYGRWQTEDYMPPIAWNGKVPRNEYGNVELFKPCMLPIGTVHLRNSGLNRIAKKLNIDCSPAVVGFDGHRGSIHPVFDGFIVCEEFKDTVLAAWEEEQVNIKKRETEKKEKRVYGNWRRLIKGLLIRERLKVKYALN